MRIEHVALWARDLEALKSFYQTWFGARSGDRYENPAHGFRSYFLSFTSGPRLELMQMPGIQEPGGSPSTQNYGWVHIAVQVDSPEAVVELTDRLRQANTPVVSEPRWTGDGYFESCILDPEGNRVEITA